ncbi:MAG: hypothetical protein QF535_17700, partial [Anaerolineales bacterium]|nr:hypothetical protein [Anaerolineales bacterium]
HILFVCLRDWLFVAGGGFAVGCVLLLSPLIVRWLFACCLYVVVLLSMCLVAYLFGCWLCVFVCLLV